LQRCEGSCNGKDIARNKESCGGHATAGSEEIYNGQNNEESLNGQDTAKN
jgi:hypothetical protein